MRNSWDINKIIKIILITITIVIITGCATKKPVDPQDPLETYNRAIFKFNRTVDKLVIKPVAQVYDTLLPSPAKTGVSNFFDNVAEIPRVSNDILQLQVGWAIADAWRLIFNTSLGIGGLFDVATHFGLKRRQQDLGITLARWGAKDSDYFVLPILGPSTIRDSIGLILGYELLTVYPHIDPWTLRWGLLSLYFIRLRAELLPADKLVNQAFDPYVFVRNAYLQRRKYLIKGEKAEQEDTYIEDNGAPERT